MLCAQSITLFAGWISNRSGLGLKKAYEEMEKAEDAHICQACGVQFSPVQNLPEVCPICSDERQAVPKWVFLWH